MQRDRHLASGDLCRESAPLSQGSRASLLVDLPRYEMALLTELVVHLSLDSGAKRNGVRRSGFARPFQARQARLAMAS